MISNDPTMAIKHRYAGKCRLATMVDKIIIAILLVAATTNANEVKDNHDNFNKSMKIVESVSGRYFNDVYQNGTFRTGNVLWDNILNQCTVTPSVSCLQKNVYSYIDEKLELNGDVEVGGGMCFNKNNVDINKYSKEANIIYITGSKGSEEEKQRYLDEENEIKDEFEPESPFEEISDALYEKSVKFLVTHDMKLKMPDYFFEGATLKVSPRALTKTGALLHVELLPKEDDTTGRLFLLHKIKKQIKRKLITAAIAIVLVVKLIALKLVFVLPLILGVTTAKKMFLKLLLFLFPALSHIFKLCSWYHQNYHTTKYHHHHHLITHHHKVPPVHHGAPGHAPYGSSLVVKQPGHASSPGFEHYPQDWELSGPGLGNEYLSSDIHRNAIANFKPHENDANDINAWGLGMPPGYSSNVGEYASANVPVPNIVSPNTGPKIPSGGAGRPVGPPNPYYNNRGKKATTKDPLSLEKEALIRAAALAARAPPSPFRDEILRVSAVKLKENNRVKTETDLVKQQQEIIAASDPETIAAEKFYGALLDRVDAVLAPLGANDAGCRERAVCSLYGDPFKHAPYSNLVSNELSKESRELLPAADSKMALRYYKYVQAARDGQEQKDCAIFYPQCHIDFDRQRKKVLLLYLQVVRGQPEMEKYHNPEKYLPQLSHFINGSEPPHTIAPTDKSPDYRIPEPPFFAYKEKFHYEEERPYRLQPFYKAYKQYYNKKDDKFYYGCYCCTVYKRLTPLATCAVITTRHILTTASSTELVLRENRKIKTLENILGAWYDMDQDNWNCSMYASVARIHYHPRFLRPNLVNTSHPLPMCTFDLAVYAATYRFVGQAGLSAKAIICPRGGAWWLYIDHGVPSFGQLMVIAGFQFIKAYRRRPLPWHKYIIRTRKVLDPCPKTEWGWFFCVQTPWAKYGIDSGAGLHRNLEGKSWMYDGLIGMHAMSMKLRSQTIVLDWLYSSYMGRQKYEWLDWRFYDSQWQAPIAKPWFYVPWVYPVGDQWRYNDEWFFNK
ncbi:hypothetical protein K1T71_013636 [Dendrolimus kikuchii]|uniref:Uncharacterized protein n=1 Tax=Dendrolimus kikuchii TaxID=765133 RepID=A0ACC1CH21_9NEOP|nr:hypothetical protein K1T71_013636 [Dendrolimus kikuchii]